jgi:DNA-binding LacI/PurR family transcriptional regulator
MSVKRRPTLHDVAKLTGVSYQTVSRVVNQHPSVATETRERILQAIRQLDYQPNTIARSLVTDRSHHLGIISFGTQYFGPAQILYNLENTFHDQGYDLILKTLHRLDLDELRDTIRDLRSRRVAGIVMIAPVLELEQAQIERLCGTTPFVMTSVEPCPSLSSVIVDQHLGTQLATQHLIQLGHRHFAHISGPLHWSDAKLRCHGVEDTLLQQGLPKSTNVMGDWGAQSGYNAIQQLLADRAHFTALVAANDQMALGAIAALTDYGLGVPDDVSVVGFDDIPEAAFFRPPLTTIRQDFHHIGSVVAEYLSEQIFQSSTSHSQLVIAPTLTVRHSTAAVKGG